MTSRSTSFLLNLGHAVDHMFLLIFATAVGSIAVEFGFARWEDLMPYSAGAFFMFGIGSVPAGRLGDLWGRRPMMLVFFFGMGCAAILVGLVQGPWQLAGALVLLGAFASIYHPIGIPMLVQSAANPGFTIGVNGLAGNLGVAIAALATGLLVKYFGWRMAFIVPGFASIACGIAFALSAPAEGTPPAKRAGRSVVLPEGMLARIFLIMTLAAAVSSMIFNFTTNGNGQLLAERFRGVIEDPAVLGALLAVVYALASLTQLVVGKLIDRYPLKAVWMPLVALQVPLFALAAVAEGWALYALMVVFMMTVFGAIPFTDALVVRYVDDRMRSRVSGMRLAVAFGISSAAVWALGPFVKAAGFQTLLLLMAAIAVCSVVVVATLPREPQPDA
jgi:MFS family permease